jgi:hypothetical protein
VPRDPFKSEASVFVIETIRLCFEEGRLNRVKLSRSCLDAEREQFSEEGYGYLREAEHVWQRCELTNLVALILPAELAARRLRARRRGEAISC